MTKYVSCNNILIDLHKKQTNTQTAMDEHFPQNALLGC